MDGWHRVSDSLPDEGKLVDAITPNGTPTQLRRRGDLWFIPDGSMYVYYTPEWWRYWP